MPDILDKRPNTESSQSLPVKGYTEDRENMEDIAELIDLQSIGASARVSARVVLELICVIRANKILREFFFRVSGNPVLPERFLVVPEGKQGELRGGR